jgi:hypothetical protein
MPEKFTDTLTYVLSVALAAGVIAFAAYKVIRLNGMEDPPANMGLNFPPPRRRIIIDQAAGADPIITQTVAPVLTPERRPAAAAGPGPVRSFELLAVVDGVAFVEIDVARGKTLLPVSVGTVLPGGLRIDAIVRRNGRWVLEAGPLRIEEARTPLQ